MKGKSKKESANRTVKMFPFATLWITVLCLSLQLSPSLICDAKEIIATDEWQILEEGDTIPQGLHVRMDITTGKKMVKLMSRDDEGQLRSEAIAVTANSKSKVEEREVVQTNSNKNGGVKITHLQNTELTPEASAKITNSLLEQSRGKSSLASSIAALDDFPIAQDQPEEYDYVMMHRALSSLPQDEQDRMGGIPPFPDSSSSGEELNQFVEKIQGIWKLRQEALKKMEEEYMANVPNILKERIEFLKEYLTDPISHLKAMIIRSEVQWQEKHDNDNDADEYDENKYKARDILTVLEDIEYHLSDVDDARDFHTMGGWPLLVSLLSDHTHRIRHHQAILSIVDDINSLKLNGTDTDATANMRIEEEIENMHFQLQELVWNIQSKASWAIGSAVKNMEEFHSWALEDFSEYLLLDANAANDEESGEAKQGAVTVVSMLLSNFATMDGQNLPYQHHSPYLVPSLNKTRQKYLYALGALLRGNRLATRHFYSIHGPSVLSDLIHSILQTVGGKGADDNGKNDDVDVSLLNDRAATFISKVVALADDIITDINLHSDDDLDGDSDSNDSKIQQRNKDMDKQIIETLTTEKWCSIPIKLLTYPSFAIQERMVKATITMAPHCTFTTNQMKILRKFGEEMLETSADFFDIDDWKELQKLY